MQEKPSAAWAVLDPDPVVELSARGVIYGALESGPLKDCEKWQCKVSDETKATSCAIGGGFSTSQQEADGRQTPND